LAVFVNALQILLWIITSPTYILLLTSRITGNELSGYDQAFSKGMFVIVIIEFFADQQQWVFHKAKTAYNKTAKVPNEYKYTREQLDRGFSTSGLWAWSRHPNFAAEQAFWVSLYQWACLESYTFTNWTFAGAFSYLILFQSSTWLTELLSAGKYPEYKVYQERVGKFLPKLLTRSMDAPKTEKEVAKVQEAKAKAAKGKKL
jgi:steroid 5-alpha reductase family enzyme